MTRRGRNIVLFSCAVAGAVFSALALARFHSFHNETFDLAFYTRIAWGLARADFWEPIVNAHVLGLHISPVLLPLGVLGVAFGTAHVLLVSQAIAVAAAAWPLARAGARRFGTVGGVAAAIAFLAYPNLSHVAANEFHPGSVAILPLAWALDALDREDPRGLVLGCVGVLLCREDLGLMTMIIGALAWRTSPQLRATGMKVALASLVYVLLFTLVFHPLFAPKAGSLEAHFAKWGSSTTEVALTWITRPDLVVRHFLVRDRLLYLPVVLLPLGLVLPLLRARWLLPAAPVLLVNLLSDFPATTDLDSHYLTPAVPCLVFAAIDGARVVAARWPSRGPLFAVVPAATALIAHAFVGGTPASARFDASAYRWDERSSAAAKIVNAIPAGVSVQAPDNLLPHLAERLRLHRAPPPEARTRFVVLDAWHRLRWFGNESLLRTVEEPIVRSWLARKDHALIMASGQYLLLERGRKPREGIGARAIVGTAPVDEGQRLTECLAVRGVRRVPATRGNDDRDRVALDLVARSACAADLAIRLGVEPRPRRAELLFGGLLSPAHVRPGDHLMSVHRVPGVEHTNAIWIMAVRSSGARPDPQDPKSVRVVVQ